MKSKPATSTTVGMWASVILIQTTTDPLNLIIYSVGWAIMAIMEVRERGEGER